VGDLFTISPPRIGIGDPMRDLARRGLLAAS